MRTLLEFLLLICFSLIHTNTTARLISPCPNVFSYEGDPEWDRWYGVISFSPNVELVELNYKIQLDRPSQLLVSWDGEIYSDDNINYKVYDPYRVLRAFEVVKMRILVKFNPLGTIPSVVKIVINGNTMCSVDSIRTTTYNTVVIKDQATTRFDPSFGNENSGPSEYPNNRPSNPGYNYRPNVSGYNYNSNNNIDLASYGSNQNSPSYNQGVAGPPDQNVPNYNGGSSDSGNLDIPNYANSGSNSNTSYYPVVGHSASPQNYGTISQHGDPPADTTYNIAGYHSRLPDINKQNITVTPDLQTSLNNVIINPVVTTLNVPSNPQNNKNNIDQIVQIIKTQLEQQQATTNTNKTVIVALVSPVHNNQQIVAPSPTNGTHGSTSNLDTPPVTSTYRTTTTNTTNSSTYKIKTLTTSTKQPVQRINKE